MPIEPLFKKKKKAITFWGNQSLYMFKMYYIYVYYKHKIFYKFLLRTWQRIFIALCFASFD